MIPLHNFCFCLARANKSGHLSLYITLLFVLIHLPLLYFAALIRLLIDFKNSKWFTYFYILLCISMHLLLFLIRLVFYLFSVSLWRRAYARNVRLYYPYRQYTNIYISISIRHCLLLVQPAKSLPFPLKNYARLFTVMKGPSLKHQLPVYTILLHYPIYTLTFTSVDNTLQQHFAGQHFYIEFRCVYFHKFCFNCLTA